MVYNNLWRRTGTSSPPRQILVFCTHTELALENFSGGLETQLDWEGRDHAFLIKGKSKIGRES